jgi:hypothetical protein
MYFAEIPRSDCPMFVAIASNGAVVLGFCHADELATALVWCGRAMQEFGQAQQIAIGRPAYTDWPGFGRVFGVVPSEGWLRRPDGWHHATGNDLQRFFEHVPAEPRSFDSSAPPATAVRSAGRARETASIPRQAAVRPLLRVNEPAHAEVERGAVVEALKTGG